jgi:hypothetical protein
MPITLRDVAAPMFSIDAVCGLDSEAETEAIIRNGIGKGCSMEVV